MEWEGSDSLHPTRPESPKRSERAQDAKAAFSPLPPPGSTPLLLNVEEYSSEVGCPMRLRARVIVECEKPPEF